MKNAHVVALHEIGHSLAQAVLDVGPSKVEIKSVEDHWEGQSLPDDNANTEEKIVRLLVSQLAGPIAQIVSAPKSLGNLADVLRTRLLDPCIDLYFAADQPLNQLGWEGDLGRCGLVFLARSFQAVWHDMRFYVEGGFLFHAEEALFAAYSEKSLACEMRSLADQLVETRFFSKETFQRKAEGALKSSAWERLRALDLAFPPPFKMT